MIKAIVVNCVSGESRTMLPSAIFIHLHRSANNPLQYHCILVDEDTLIQRSFIPTADGKDLHTSVIGQMVKLTVEIQKEVKALDISSGKQKIPIMFENSFV